MENENHLLWQLLGLCSPQIHREKHTGQLRGAGNHSQHKAPAPPVPRVKVCHCAPLRAGSEPQGSSSQSQPRAGSSSSPMESPHHQDRPLEQRPRRITRSLHRKNYSSKSHFYLLCSPLPRGISSGTALAAAQTNLVLGCKRVCRNPVRRDPDVRTKCRKF